MAAERYDPAEANVVMFRQELGYDVYTVGNIRSHKSGSSLLVGDRTMFIKMSGY
jgi:hypothetical protein